MAANIPTTVFRICTSAGELTDCPDEYGSLFSNAELTTVLEIMHIDLNLKALSDYYFDDIAVGEGDVLVFSSTRFTESYFIIDLYKELTDQLDCICFYINSPHQEVIEQIKPHLRHFFDQIEYQFSYEEKSLSATVKNLLTCQSGETWQAIEESDYLQKIIYHSGNFAH